MSDLDSESEDVPLKEIDPGIKEVVRYLNRAGFKTTDSGDGVSKFQGEGSMEGALGIPHVFIKSHKSKMIRDSDDLKELLGSIGIRVSSIGVADVSIEATYDPVDQSCVIALFGLNDEMLKKALMEPA